MLIYEALNPNPPPDIQTIINGILGSGSTTTNPATGVTRRITPDGTIIQTEYPNGTVIYEYPRGGAGDKIISKQTNPDGSYIAKYSNGVIRTDFPDGTSFRQPDY